MEFHTIKPCHYYIAYNTWALSGKKMRNPIFFGKKKKKKKARRCLIIIAIEDEESEGAIFPFSPS